MSWKAKHIQAKFWHSGLHSLLSPAWKKQVISSEIERMKSWWEKLTCTGLRECLWLSWDEAQISEGLPLLLTSEGFYQKGRCCGAVTQCVLGIGASYPSLATTTHAVFAPNGNCYRLGLMASVYIDFQDTVTVTDTCC